MLQPYSRKLYERHTRNMSTPFKLLFIFLELKCADSLRKVGLYEKPANTAFIKKVQKTANRCHISVEDLKNKRIFPSMQKEIEKRIELFKKANKERERECRRALGGVNLQIRPQPVEVSTTWVQNGFTEEGKFFFRCAH